MTAVAHQARDASFMAVSTDNTPLTVLLKYEGEQRSFESVPVTYESMAPNMIGLDIEIFFHEVKLEWPQNNARIELSIENNM